MIRRERGGDNRGRGQRVYRNNYKGHMDNNKRGDGEGGGDGWGRGERWGNRQKTILEQQ